MKKKNAVALGLFLTMAMSMPASAIDASNVHRRDGSDRVKTSLESAKMVDSKVLVLASGYSYADSLSASNVVLKTGGKLVLVGEKTDVAALLKGNNYEKIYIVGGEKTLPKSVEESAKKLSKNVIRLSGANRYGTNEKTLNEFKLNDVGVADGENYPDALSASALLKDKNLGLLLVNGVKPYKTNHNVKYTFGYSVKQDAGKRLAGKDRYATNLAVLNELGRKDNIAIASGEVFPDALSAINVVTAKDASVVLVRNNTNKISKDLNDYIEKAKDAYILGGTSTISKDVAKFLICENKTETPSYSGGGGGGGSHSYRPADIVNDFNSSLQEALNDANIPESVATYEYNRKERKATVDVNGKDTKVTELKNTGLASALDDLVKNHHLHSYKIEGMDNERDLEALKNNTTEIRAAVLEDFAKALNVNSADLTLGKLLDKGSLSADVKLDLGNGKTSEPVKYTVKFVDNEDEYKTEVKKEFNKNVNNAITAIKVPDSVKVSPDFENNTKVVNIVKPGTPVSEITGTNAMVQLENLVKENNKGYTLKSYKIEGKDFTEVNLTGMNKGDIKAKIVEDLAKAAGVTNGNPRLVDFAGKKISADVKLVDNLGNETTDKYTVSFNLTEKALQDNFDSQLAEAIAPDNVKIPDTAGTYTYDKKTKTAEFTVKDAKAKVLENIRGKGLGTSLNNLIQNDFLYSYKIDGMDAPRVLAGLSQADQKSAVVEDMAKVVLNKAVAGDRAEAANITFGQLAKKFPNGLSADVVVKAGNKEATEKYTIKFVDGTVKPETPTNPETPANPETKPVATYEYMKIGVGNDAMKAMEVTLKNIGINKVKNVIINDMTLNEGDKNDAFMKMNDGKIVVKLDKKIDDKDINTFKLVLDYGTSVDVKLADNK